MTAIGTSSSYDLQDPRKFFIAYKKDSGEDFAKHLHDGLHDRGVDTFLDKFDLEEGLSSYMWRKQREQAIIDSECFILILTHSTCSSREVKYELKIALEQDNMDIRVFVHDHIWNNDNEYLITINKRVINISDFQLGHFDTKESLLREVSNSISIMRKFDPEEIDMIRQVIMEPHSDLVDSVAEADGIPEKTETDISPIDDRGSLREELKRLGVEQVSRGPEELFPGIQGIPVDYTTFVRLINVNFESDINRINYDSKYDNYWLWLERDMTAFYYWDEK